MLALAVRDFHPLDSIRGFHRLIFGSSSSTLSQRDNDAGRVVGDSSFSGAQASWGGVKCCCFFSEVQMRISESSSVAVAVAVASLLVATPALAQKQLAQSPRILSAKSIYFKNQTGSDAVGKNAVAQLRRWGKFQLVDDPKQADLIFFFSADPYKGGSVLFASGQTGTSADGHITEDPVPNYNKQSSARYAYLTVIDPKTRDILWSDEHLWGGVLTGVNSVGERLVKELEKQTKK